MAMPRRHDRGEEGAPFRRLFIIHGKATSEDEVVEAFKKYGDIDDVYYVTDKRSNEAKGFSYVTFRKTSQAAQAMEELHGEYLGNTRKPIKVVLATDKGTPNSQERSIEEMLRLFVVIPKDFEEKDLKNAFKEYGDIEFVTIIRDRNSDKPKGFGYVKFRRAQDSAKAYEQCASSYKVKFADPPGKHQAMKRAASGFDERRDRDYDYYDRPGPSRGRPEPRMRPPLMMAPGMPGQMMAPSMTAMGDGGMRAMMDTPANQREVEGMITSSHVTKEQVMRLFDLVPGLRLFNMNRETGHFRAAYMTSEFAAHAVEKLDGFEYPVGHPLSVKFLGQGRGESSRGNGRDVDLNSVIQQLQNPKGRDTSTLVKAMESIATLLKDRNTDEVSAGFTTRTSTDGNEYVDYCDFVVPAKKPLANQMAHCEERLFFVSKPYPISEPILVDLFRRFGDLINVQLVAGKNYGYARFASKDSADRCIDTLHLREINGQFLKVMVAEPMRDDGSPTRKRRRSNSNHWERE